MLFLVYPDHAGDDMGGVWPCEASVHTARPHQPNPRAGPGHAGAGCLQPSSAVTTAAARGEPTALSRCAAPNAASVALAGARGRAGGWAQMRR
jgi:hypothetical protein